MAVRGTSAGALATGGAPLRLGPAIVAETCANSGNEMSPGTRSRRGDGRVSAPRQHVLYTAGLAPCPRRSATAMRTMAPSRAAPSHRAQVRLLLGTALAPGSTRPASTGDGVVVPVGSMARS